MYKDFVKWVRMIDFFVFACLEETARSYVECAQIGFGPKSVEFLLCSGFEDDLDVVEAVGDAVARGTQFSRGCFRTVRERHVGSRESNSIL